MYQPFNSASVFLVQTLFNLYLFILLLRMILQWQCADYYNPIVQLTVRLTDPLVRPLRKILPRLGWLDLATILILLLVTCIKITLLFWLDTGGVIYPVGLAIWVVGDLLSQLLNLYFFVILFRVIISWVSPNPYNPAVAILTLISEPILRPFRRVIPMVAGFDLTPILAIIFLKTIDILLTVPLIQQGMMRA